jgi:hypothetical protein
MREQSEHDAPRPLPRGWLPDPQPPEGTLVWEARTRRIMAAAGPEFWKLTSAHSAAEVTWWSVMAPWWKTAAALAVASTVLLLLAGRRAGPPQTPPGSIPLGLVASGGDPVTLWRALGIQADPVLAQIAIREQTDATRQDSRSTIPEEKNR